jgi:hypothetical protein
LDDHISISRGLKYVTAINEFQTAVCLESWKFHTRQTNKNHSEHYYKINIIVLKQKQKQQQQQQQQQQHKMNFKMWIRYITVNPFYVSCTERIT